MNHRIMMKIIFPTIKIYYIRNAVKTFNNENIKSFFTLLKIESYSIVYYEVMQYEKSLETLCYLFRCD